MPKSLQGKPFRRLQREINQRLYKHPHRNLLLIAQIKSGSTWLWRLLADTPGYVRWNPETIKWWGQDLSVQTLDPPPSGYTVSKAHSIPTPGNIEVVERLDRPYIILIRDLRDTAVSWSFYARNRPTAPNFRQFAGMTQPELLDHFIAHELESFRQWQLGWLQAMHPTRGLLLRYEDLLADTLGELRRAQRHFGVYLSDDAIRRIIEKHSFSKTTGRQRGHEDATQFNRKGVAGDWMNHLTPGQKEAFKAQAGDALILTGCEKDNDW